MTNTTPNKAIPYAEASDARGAGAVAMQDLAERVDELLTAMDPIYLSGVRPESLALANNVWTPVDFTAFDDGTITHDADTFTYSGPARWFMLSFGGNVGANGSQPNAGLRLVVGSSVVADLRHTDNYSHLGGAVPFRMGSGTGYELVELHALANDGSGASGGTIDTSWLRVVSLS